MINRNYAVRCRDVDGSSVRHYASLGKAIARFEEMAGMKASAAIAEQLEGLEWNAQVPSVNEALSFQAVSAFGTVVEFECVSSEAIAAAKAARAADWAVVCSVQAYDDRDAICGAHRHVVSHHAREEEASAAIGQLLEPDGPDSDVSYFVARKSEGYRRPAPDPRPAPVADDDIWF